MEQAASQGTGDGIPPVGNVLDGVYRVERLIGTGAMGYVLAAEDLALGRRVAVKVLWPSIGQRAEAVLRFRREARAMARVHSPYAVKLHGFGVLDGGACYLVMELVDGEPLARVLKREGRLPARRAVAILRKIAEVLLDAHAQGVIHRDLKPDNVLVATRGDERDFVKVVDFGLARLGEAPGDVALTGQGVVLGTPAYMSPEQIQGTAVDHRADLYALGCMAYEMLLGRRPFERDSVQAMLFAHLTEPLPAPRDLNPDVVLPPALDGLLVQLMARRAQDRPAGAARVLEILDEVMAGLPVDGSSPVAAPVATNELASPTVVMSAWEAASPWADTIAPGARAGGRPAAGALVGRSEEQRALWDTLGSLVRTHRPQVVLLTGAPGTGKTELAEWLVEQAAAQGGVKVAVGRHLEGGLAPLQAVCDIAATLLGVSDASDEELGRRIAAAVPGAGASEQGEDAARFFLRLLRPELDPETSLPPLEADAQRAYLLANLRRLIYSRAGDQPLLLVVEDLHWADETTRQIVAELAESLGREPAPVALIATAREEIAAEGGALGRLAEPHRARRQPWLSLLRLAPLSREDTVALARRQMEVTDKLADTIHRLSNGNPQLVIQLTEYLREADLVRRTSAGWALGSSVDASTILPPDLRQLQAMRVERVLSRQPDPALARRVLEQAAVLGVRLPLDLLAVALAESGEKLDPATLEEVLDGLLAQEVLRLDDAADDVALSFPDELVREAVVATLGMTLRARRVHAAAARAKTRHFGETLPRHARAVAEHHRRARSHRAALDLFLVAARTALRQANAREAIECFEAADGLAELAKAPMAQRAEIRLELGRLHGGFAQYDDSERHMLRAEEALAAAGLPTERLRLERAGVLAARGELQPAYELAQEAAAADPALEAEAAARLGEIARLQGRLEDADRHLRAALDKCPVENPGLKTRTLLSLGLMLLTRGALTEAEGVLADCLEAHAEVDDPAGRARCLNGLGVLAYFRGDSREAGQRYRDSLAISRRLGDQAAIGRSEMNLGVILHKEGRYAPAFEAYEASLAMFRAIGNRHEEANVEQNLGLALLEVGEIHEADEHLVAARRVFEGIGDRLGAATADSYRASGFARAGRQEAAAALLKRTLDTARELGAESHVASLLVLASSVERERGNSREARVQARRALTLVLKEERGGDVGLAKSALAAAHGGDPTELRRALVLLNEARESLERQGDLRHLVEVDLRLGAVRDALGQTDEAEQHLRAALDRSEETGFLNGEVVRAYEHLAVLARRRGDEERAKRTVARRDAAAARLVAGGGHVRSEVR